MPANSRDSALIERIQSAWLLLAYTKGLQNSYSLKIVMPERFVDGSKIRIEAIPNVQDSGNANQPDALLFIDEELNGKNAVTLSGYLAILRSARGFSNTETLGFLLNLLVRPPDALSRFEVLENPNRVKWPTPRKAALLDVEEISETCESNQTPILQIDFCLHAFNTLAANNQMELFDGTSNEMGRWRYLTIPPEWVYWEQLKELGKFGSIQRRAPVSIDLELLPWVTMQSDLFDETERLAGKLKFSFGEATTTSVESPNPSGPTFRRTGTNWELRFNGKMTLARSTVGMEYIAILLASPHQEFHSIQLVNRVRKNEANPDRDQQAEFESGVKKGEYRDSTLDGTGPDLDEEQKKSYTQRIRKLDIKLERAERTGDVAQAASIENERLAIIKELKSAIGIYGRDRDSNSPEERARTSVQKAIVFAYSRLILDDPVLVSHLKVSIKTSRYCAYRPADNLQWET